MIKRSFTGARSIVIKNGQVIIDGKKIELEDVPEITLEISGDALRIDADNVQEITVNGNVTEDVKTMSGNIRVQGSVGGNVKSMSGDIHCGDVAGKVETMSGDITRK